MFWDRVEYAADITVLVLIDWLIDWRCCLLLADRRSFSMNDRLRYERVWYLTACNEMSTDDICGLTEILAIKNVSVDDLRLIEGWSWVHLRASREQLTTKHKVPRIETE